MHDDTNRFMLRTSLTYRPQTTKRMRSKYGWDCKKNMGGTRSDPIHWYTQTVAWLMEEDRELAKHERNHELAFWKNMHVRMFPWAVSHFTCVEVQSYVEVNFIVIFATCTEIMTQPETAKCKQFGSRWKQQH